MKDEPTGQILRRAGLISEEKLREALRLQEQWDARLGEVVQAKGWVRPIDFYRALAHHLDRPFVNLMEEPPDPRLLREADVETYGDLLTLPWRQGDGSVVLATADPGEEARTFARERYGDDAALVVTSKFDVIWSIQRIFRAELTETALNRLWENAPEHSARTVFTKPQLGALYLMLVGCLAGFVFLPLQTAIATNAVAMGFYFISLVFRGALLWVGTAPEADLKITREDVEALEDDDLPPYTILVPMFRESEVLPILAQAIRDLDYPVSRLDVKLVLEEEDRETIRAAKGLGLESIFEIIRVPPSQPQTKPKACNYALAFARGDYVTIYDAEDRPEPDQLKKVVAAFRKAPEEQVCVQARLNYYNAEENWLTRMFTLDYSLWFDFLVPGLERMGVPIPLGGTSNHFRIDALRELHAWDPYNVTEDADLGLRLAQRGWRTGTVNSTTFEEANSQLGNWIRQRSRWIKGYMQTWLVHMRRPLETYRSLGHAGFWGFQLFIGGTYLTALLNPLVWILFLIWLAVRMPLEPFFPAPVLYMSLVNLLLGNGLFVYFHMVGAFRRHNFGLIPFALTAPVYWALMSVAGYKALWQLLHKPFFWEKTEHGLSERVAELRAQALGTT